MPSRIGIITCRSVTSPKSSGSSAAYPFWQWTAMTTSADRQRTTNMRCSLKELERANRRRLSAGEGGRTSRWLHTRVAERVSRERRLRLPSIELRHRGLALVNPFGRARSGGSELGGVALEMVGVESLFVRGASRRPHGAG